MDEIVEKLDKTLLFVVIYTLSFFIFFKTLGYTLPFVLAFIFALILKKPTELLIQKFKVKKSISALITTLLFFTIIISLFYFIITSISKEAIQLGKNTQSYALNNSDNISNFFKNIKVHYKSLDPTITSSVKNSLEKYISNISNFVMVLTSKIIQSILSLLGYIPYLFMVILFTLLSTYFFTKDLTEAKSKFLNTVPLRNSRKLISVINQVKKMLMNYFMSYLFVIFLTFLETLIGFLIFRVKYAVILSIIAAIFDILPILGIGGVYIPLSLVYFFVQKNYFVAFGILIWYIAVTIARQILEPKIVSSTLGIHPVSVLASIFIGLKIGGVSGMFFCMFLVIFYKVLKNVNII